MITFDNTVFKLNPNLKWETIDTPVAKVTIIDDFYEDFNSVYREMLKLPGAATACNTPDEMIDYRKSYAANMAGTGLPFTGDYSSKVRDIISYDGDVSTTEALMINVNKLLCDKHKDNWYNIHQDPVNTNWNDIISTVVMLNKNYDTGEGTNFYYHSPSTESNWFAKGTVRRSFFVQGKPNRAILFSPYYWHGAAFGGDQFRSEYRYTQVIFTNLR